MTEQISVTRTFDAPRALVWEVVTGREHFAEWFGTDAVDVPLDTPGWSPDARAATTPLPRRACHVPRRGRGRAGEREYAGGYD